jgi:hypothetical protein
VRGRAFRKTVQPVAAFEHRHDPAFTQLVGESDNHAGNRGVAVWRDVELPEQVSAHTVEAGAHKNEVGFEPPGGSGTFSVVPAPLPAPVSTALPVPG